MKISLVSKRDSVTNVLYTHNVMNYKCSEELLISLFYC